MALKLLFVFQLVIAFCLANQLPPGKESLGRIEETLDENGKYVVGWQVYSDVKVIAFDVTVETLGFVGFGISPVGGMNAADIVIGGVYENGTAYFTDRHGTGDREPTIDDKQDWHLLEYSQNGSHTTLKFSRLLNTCDPQDVFIGNDTTNFIWSYGASDEIAYHESNRGTMAVNALDPPMPPFDHSQFLRWRMTTDLVMPPKKTTYWCTVKKSPPLMSKHHIVGFRPLLETSNARKFTHHFIVHKCTPPVGSTAEATFERYITGPGGECYTPPFTNVPLQHCQHYLFVWGVGGKMVIYPDHVGYPVGVNGETNYYLLEVHYDNPNEEENLQFETGLELFYTSQIREFDAGTITSGHETSWAITIPPKSKDFTVVGHCGPQCTNTLPSTGIKIFNVLLHSHLAGRQMKLRHFRGNEELPWMAVDMNYNFDYQQNRPLIEERLVLPGDQLTYECHYDSTWADGAIVGGMSTTEEMCNAFLWYYPDVGLEVCSSEYPKPRLMQQLGIEAMGGGWDPLVSAPPSLANKTYTEVLDTMTPWTEETRRNFQQELKFTPHNSVCKVGTVSGKLETLEDSLVQYPEISEPYAPIDAQCKSVAHPLLTSYVLLFLSSFLLWTWF